MRESVIITERHHYRMLFEHLDEGRYFIIQVLGLQHLLQLARYCSSAEVVTLLLGQSKLLSHVKFK